MALLKREGDKFIFVCNRSESNLPRQYGFTWDKDKKIWWTRHYAYAYKLIKFADTDTRFFFERDKRQYIASKATKLEAQFHIPIPENQTLREYQRAGIYYIYWRLVNAKDSKKGVLVADEQGLGKTVEIICTINLLQPKKILIICPLTLKINWLEELEKWLTVDYNIYLFKNDVFIPYVNKQTNKEIKIIHYDAISREKFQFNENFDLLVVDEAHFIKNKKSKRTKFIKKINADYRIYATGTPLVNNPLELHTIISDLTTRFKDWFYFRNRYCIGYQDKFGWHFIEAKNTHELSYLMRATVMLRRRKNDVLTELPSKIIQTIRIDSEFSDAEQLEDMIKMKYQDFFTNFTSLRHKIGKEKINHVVEFVQSLFEEEDKKTIIFSHHRDVSEEIYKKLKHFEPLLLIGGLKEEEKNNILNLFKNNNKHKILITNVKIAGVGLNLTEAKRIVFAELPLTYSDIEQAEDRIHRIGQDSVVNIYYLIFQNSQIENTICNILENKLQQHTKLLNGNPADLIKLFETTKEQITQV
ncbi:MAG: DEAD/DEAH box helicase [Endomicrobia bacterium]|nr:DEAD/DEAH box helicase [Endomicrobiia bacterium]